MEEEMLLRAFCAAMDAAEQAVFGTGFIKKGENDGEREKSEGDEETASQGVRPYSARFGDWYV